MFVVIVGEVAGLWSESGVLLEACPKGQVTKRASHIAESREGLAVVLGIHVGVCDGWRVCPNIVGDEFLVVVGTVQPPVCGTSSVSGISPGWSWPSERARMRDSFVQC